MSGHFKIENAAGGRFHFNLVAGNGAIILTSGLFDSKDAALTAIELARTSAGFPERFERKVAKNKESYFLLRTAEGEVLGRSEMYGSTSSMENGIKSVMKNGPVATLKDLTEAEPVPATT